MQFCQGSASSPALLFTGMKKGIEYFSAVHIVLRCLKELLKSMWGGGRAKRNHRRREGREHARGGSQKHIYNPRQPAQPIPLTPQHCSFPPSFPGSPSAGVGAHLLSKVWKTGQCIGLSDTSLVKYFVLGALGINCLPREWLHDTLISFFLQEIWDIIWLNLSGCSLLFSLLSYCTVWISLEESVGRVVHREGVMFNHR